MKYKMLFRCLIACLSCSVFSGRADFTCPGSTDNKCSFGICDTAQNCPQDLSLLDEEQDSLFKCNDFTFSRFESLTCELPECENKITCWDGSCRKERSLCPTPIYCPPAYIKCFDNSCVSNKSLCPNYKECPIFLPYTCPNGDCRKSLEDCPEITNCPKDYMIKCNDGSCKKTKGSCLYTSKQTRCNDKNLVRCSDGTCSPSKLLCPTLITNSKCSDGKVRCNDGRCDEIDKCKNVSTCPGDEVRCAMDNTCKASIYDCPTGLICPTSRPVKCWDGSCKESFINCPNYVECPKPLFSCPDGSCSKSEVCGTQITCSMEAPYKCWDNTCKSNPDDCPEMGNCPPDKPFFCWDGICYKKREKCLSPPKINGVLCPDYQSRGSVDECKATSSCPIGFYRQLDGSCRKNKRSGEDLKQKICPDDAPIKCLDGLCMKSKILCNQSISKNIQGTKVRCADGTLADKFSDCKPRFIKAGEPKGECPKGFIICDKNNACVQNSKDCLNTFGCPSELNFRCPDNGLCVRSLSDCRNLEKSIPKSNGCSFDLSIKCKNGNVGKCVSKADDCNVCSKLDESMCEAAGECMSLEICAQIPFDQECKKKYKCINTNKCVDDLSQCQTKENCPFNKPFRCLDGSCKKYPFNFYTKNETVDNDSCEIGIACPSYKPILCADGSCVEKISFCKSFPICSNNISLNTDRTCGESLIKRCPANNPILCTNIGNCVSSIYDCINQVCPPDLPIKCTTGDCVDNPRACFNEAFPCLEDEFICIDGSCRSSQDDCPLYQGCQDLAKPYKCKNGSCQVDQKACLKIEKGETTTSRMLEDKTQCIGNQNLCEDGICRKTCPQYNGCTNEAPLLCSNGICVKTLSECAALSLCNFSTPFRCSDGDCKKNIDECPEVKKVAKADNVLLFTYPGLKVDKDIVLSNSNQIIGKVTIYPTSIVQQDESTKQFQAVPSIIKFNTVPQSMLKESYVRYNETRLDDISFNFRFGDKNGNYTLEYDYSVISPVVQISFYNTDKTKKSNLQFFDKEPLTLTLQYDFPTNADVEESQLDRTKDICMAYLDENYQEFKCLGTIALEVTGNEISQEILKEGMYAVVIFPEANKQVIIIKDNFLAKYLLIASIVFLVLIVVFLIGLYIFMRIYRYKAKYQITKMNSKKITDQMQEMQNLASSHLGQTIGDSLDHIIFTNNPCYKLVRSKIRSARLIELEGLQQKFLKRQEQLSANEGILDDKILQIKDEIKRLISFKN